MSINHFNSRCFSSDCFFFMAIIKKKITFYNYAHMPRHTYRAYNSVIVDRCRHYFHDYNLTNS